jgi:tRNA pseudouridine38-40 synthase
MLKVTVAYDGTNYVGWQRQANGTSVQGLLEEAMARLEGGLPVTVTGAGRTDAGVHALGQVASVRVTSSLTCARYVRALNAALPDDVRVRHVEEMPESFHARFDARAKTYCYRIINHQIASPFETRHAWHVTYPLDYAAMREALTACLGEHDFAAFKATDSSVSSTVRAIHAAALETAPGLADPETPVLTLTVTGDGFLRHMVRNLMGTLIEVGRGRRLPADMSRLLTEDDRAQVGPTAPAHGLFLAKVTY